VARRTHIDAVDVHALVVAIDDIADHAEEAADQLDRATEWKRRSRQPKASPTCS
jgi:uncharacterized protein Yka (UPF0111/DUF47 family)